MVFRFLESIKLCFHLLVTKRTIQINFLASGSYIALYNIQEIMKSLTEQFLSVHRSIPLTDKKNHPNNNINYHIFSKLIERKKQHAYQACNNMIYFHPNMLFCRMERIDRFSLLYQDRPQNISFSLSVYCNEADAF